MANVKIKETISKGIRNLEKRLKDMTPFFKAVADLELSQTKLRYKDEVDPDGNPWPDPFTIRRGKAWETGSGKRSFDVDDSGVKTRKTRWSASEAWEYVKASNFHATPPGWRFFGESRGDKKMVNTGVLQKSIGRYYSKDSAVVGTNIKYAKNLQDGRFPFLGINEQTQDNVSKSIDSYLKRLGLKNA